MGIYLDKSMHSVSIENNEIFLGGKPLPLLKVHVKMSEMH
jgi:hypothetical protein